jgi:hypothetical protein
VTSGALVMVVVFGSFVLGSDQMAKQIGVGLAVAILVDRTIIRADLLPAMMKLLGALNWYLPTQLDRLPKLAPEPETGGAGRVIQNDPHPGRVDQRSPSMRNWRVVTVRAGASSSA